LASAVRIGIIGAGMIGSTAATILARQGHDVAISNSRGAASLRELAAAAGPTVRAADVAEAVEHGDIVLLAIPYRALGALPGSRFAGKVVVDAMNYFPARDAEVDLGEASSSEHLARLLPGARLVKAFNTMHFRTLAEAGRPDLPRTDRLAIFVAGDDDEAKAIIGELITGLGFAAVDTGSLAAGGRLQEPGSPIFNQPMTGDAADRFLAGRAS
jgi:predicted dinucleotide-binding enzyme